MYLNHTQIYIYTHKHHICLPLTLTYTHTNTLYWILCWTHTHIRTYILLYLIHKYILLGVWFICTQTQSIHICASYYCLSHKHNLIMIILCIIYTYFILLCIWLICTYLRISIYTYIKFIIVHLVCIQNTYFSKWEIQMWNGYLCNYLKIVVMYIM